MLVTPCSVQLPASQQAPAGHAVGLPVKQAMPQVPPAQRTFVPHDWSPLHAMVDASATASTVVGHDPCAAQAMRHDSVLAQVTAPPHWELWPFPASTPHSIAQRVAVQEAPFMHAKWERHWMLQSPASHTMGLPHCVFWPFGTPTPHATVHEAPEHLVAPGHDM